MALTASIDWQVRAAAACARPRDVPSPCIAVCTMDAASGLCRGCWRTLDEIAAWSTLPDPAKRRVWQQIARRSREPEQTR
jgi:hypothetical protein